MIIALTGGPAAGKTSTVEVLYRGYADQFCIVPEAASVLFHGGFPRDLGDEHRRCQQRAIYHVQKELENLGKLDPLKRHLICDRGSLDTLAYWPGTKESFFESVGSTIEKEIARYDWVIHLDTVPGAEYEMTTLRTETNAEALALNEKIKEAWARHPRRLIVEDSREFIIKMNITIQAIELILKGSDYADVEAKISAARPDSPFFHRRA